MDIRFPDIPEMTPLRTESGNQPQGEVMNEKTAKDQIKNKPSRVWTTQGKPSRPLNKTWDGAGKVVRDTGKGEKK